MVPLPVDPLLPELAASLARTPALVLQAPPGSGKTTRVPAGLLEAGAAGGGEVVVLEPRRIAARMAAARVAEERGESAGRSVGFKVRFEECGGADTRLWFVTEGILLRRLVADPLLAGVGLVVLDEFHERSIHADVALAMLRRLQRGQRPDLRVVVMSATLDPDPVAAFLGAHARQAEGRVHPVTIEHAPRPDDRPLPVQVASAVERVLASGPGGDVLVFLPGAAEIRQAADTCANAARRACMALVPLHGDLPLAAQDRAVRPSATPRLILATNVAETSVTIDGVVAVVDTGLARVSGHSPWSGLKTIRVARVPRASAIQRAGRAGRTRPGRCVRLYTRADFDARPERDPPEIARADLADTVLALRSMGMDPAGLEWLDAPPQAAVAAADALLHRLGALDAAGTVTALGRRMLALPLHPRQARIVVEAADRGRLADGCLLAALLEERDVRRGARSIDVGGGGTPRGEEDALASEGFLDPIEAVEAIAEADASREGDDGLRRRGLEPSAVAAVRRSRDQVCRLAARTRPEAAGVASPVERRTDLAKALLAGYPDRVGRVRRAGRGRGERSEFEAAAGGAADLPAGALLPEGGLLVVADAAERPGSRGTSLLVRAAVPIEEDWLFDLFLESIRESREVRFNASTGRVEAVRRLAFEGLVLDERPWDGADPAAIEGVLAEAARSAGLAGLAAKGEDVEGLLARVAFLRERCPELAIPELDGPAAERVVTELCRGKRSLAQVREAGVTRAVLASLTREQRRALQELAPESVRLPGGRALRIDYGPGRPPSVASRIQDFFGLAAGPAVLGGRLPLVVHLRSPGGKDVQVTTDLAGFWSNHYPSIARELRRRYPRHAWPDAPANAPAATGRGRPRQ